MSTPYTVQSGDWLQKIAEEHGFESWRDLYNHPDNAAFRAKRPDPDVIYPGDVVMIPDRETPGGEPPGTEPPPQIPPQTPPGEDTIVIAQRGDTLCSIAVTHGFRDCAPLRAHPENEELLERPLEAGDEVHVPPVTVVPEPGETEEVHEFERPGVPIAAIRFVHGSQTLDFKDDVELQALHVSNYITNQAGSLADGTRPWVDENHRAFDLNAHADEDTFKVEVADRRTTEADLTVDIEALRPQYDPADARGRRVTGHEPFDATHRPARSLLGITASRQASSDRFRTCYLRLVSDEVDKQGSLPSAAAGTAPDAGARPLQTILTTDMVDDAIALEAQATAADSAGDAARAAELREQVDETRKVQILDQQIRATYSLDTCPGTPGIPCQVRVERPIGEDRRRLRVAVHIVRRTRGGVAPVQDTDGERRIDKWMRRLYSSASVGPRRMLVRTVDPVENMIAISDETGNNARGDGDLGFRINAPGQPSQVIGPHRANNGDSPLVTAQALAGLIQPPYTATVTQNPATFNRLPGRRSADIVILGPGGNDITIDNVITNDSRQSLTVANVFSLNPGNPGTLQSWGGNNFLAGSIEQRALLKNYDTGDDVIDLFVIDRLSSTNLGEAMMSGHRVDPARRAIDPVKFSAFVIANTADGTDGNPTTISHECGHVLMELVHASGFNNATQMMTGQALPDTVGVGAPKRIRDKRMQFDTPVVFVNQVDRMRAEGGPILEAW